MSRKNINLESTHNFLSVWKEVRDGQKEKEKEEKLIDVINHKLRNKEKIMEIIKVKVRWKRN